jgi:hypothetical protein
MKYKEGACLKPGSSGATNLKTRINTINQRITDQTNNLTEISSRVNQFLLNYTNFKFSITNVNVDNKTDAYTNLDIDRDSKDSGLSKPSFMFTLVAPPTGDDGDDGNQGIPGNKGVPGNKAANGLPGYWGQRGGCST